MNGYSQFCHAESGPMCPVTSIRHNGKTYIAGWERSAVLGLVPAAGNDLQRRSYAAVIMSHGEYNDLFPATMTSTKR